MREKTTLLIDGDIIAFSSSAAGETPIDWGDGIWTLHCHFDDVYDACLSKIEGLMDKTEADDLIIAFSDDHEFRKDLYPGYKSNREGKRRPMVLKAIKQKLAEDHESFIRPGLEADDVLGILSTSKKIIKGRKIIASIDKDFYGIPGLFFDWKDDDLVEVSEEDADRWHLYQTLVGDSCDGYPGCPGVGPKTAEKILDKSCTWEAVVEAFEKKKLSEDEALLQARLARILRASDYNFKRKEPILWTP